MAQNEPLPSPSEGEMLNDNNRSQNSRFVSADGLHNRNETKPENGVVRSGVPPPSPPSRKDKRIPKYPPEYFKTFIAILFCASNFFLTTVSLALVHERVPDRTLSGPLSDVFLDNIPAYEWALDVSEVLIIVHTTSVMILIFFHKYRSILTRRVFFLMGLLYMMRAITIYVTVLPIASKTYYCSPKSNDKNPINILSNAVHILAGMGLSINGFHSYCGDYVYSGHTVILTMCSLIIEEYSPKKWYLLHWLSWLVTTVGVVFVMVAHGHYTLDVVIAYWITTQLFYMYHSMANNPAQKQSGPYNYFSRLWWFSVFTYFELNVSGIVPRRYGWPRWPCQCLSKKKDSASVV